MVIFSWGLTRNVSLRSWYLKGLCARLIVARQSREWYSGRCDAAASIAPMAVAIVGATCLPNPSSRPEIYADTTPKPQRLGVFINLGRHGLLTLGFVEPLQRVPFE